jgi:hypothetical protein
MKYLNRLLYLVLIYIVLFLQLSVVGLAENTLTTKSPLAFAIDWKPKSIPEILSTADSSQITDTNITITTDSTVLKNKLYPAGGNIEHTQTELSDPQYIANLNSLKGNYLRFPGGSKSDEYVWNKDKESRAQLVQFLKLTQATKAEPIVTFNFGTYRNNLAEGAKLADDLVEYLNSPDDGSNSNGGINWALARTKDGFSAPFNVKYFEVGNENYGEWEYGTCDNFPNASNDNCTNKLSTSNYIDAFNQYKSKVKQTAPNGFWGVSISNGSHQKWDTTVTGQLKKDTDFYDLHLYPFNQNDLQKPANELIEIAKKNTLKSLENARKTISDSGDTTKPLIIGEYNATTPEYTKLVPRTSAFVNAFSINEMIGAFNDQNIGTSLFWAYTSGFEKSIGENGSAGYHLFTNPNTTNTPTLSPYPVYYPLLFWGQMGDTLINSKSSDSDLHVWASYFSGDRHGQAVIITNTTDVAKKSTLVFQDKVGNANIWTATGEFESPTLTFNKATSGANFGGPFPNQTRPTTITINNDRTTLTLPPRSMTLVQTNIIKPKEIVPESKGQAAVSVFDKNQAADSFGNVAMRILDDNYSFVGFGMLTGISTVILLAVLAWQARTPREKKLSEITLYTPASADDDYTHREIVLAATAPQVPPQPERTIRKVNL